MIERFVELAVARTRDGTEQFRETKDLLTRIRSLKKNNLLEDIPENDPEVIRLIHGTGDKDEKVYSFGPFNYNRAVRSLTKNGERIHLTPREHDVLYILVLNKGEVVTGKTLIDTVFNDESIEDPDNLAKKYIQKLRNKLGDTRGRDGEFQYIRSLYRMGYMLVDVSLDASS